MYSSPVIDDQPAGLLLPAHDVSLGAVQADQRAAVGQDKHLGFDQEEEEEGEDHLDAVYEGEDCEVDHDDDQSDADDGNGGCNG